MKFYEQMDPVKREAMIRRAVAFNISLEGMDETAQEIMRETILLEKSPKVQATIEPTTNQTNE